VVHLAVDVLHAAHVRKDLRQERGRSVSSS
jgi:hypothetical protein